MSHHSRFVSLIHNADISITAARLLLGVQIPSGLIGRVHKAWWTPATSEDSQQLATGLVLLTGDPGVEASSGVSLRKHAASAAAWVANYYSDIARATVAADGWLDWAGNDQRNGYLYEPAPEHRVDIAGGTYLSLDLLEAPSAALAVRAGLIVEVLG